MSTTFRLKIDRGIPNTLARVAEAAKALEDKATTGAGPPKSVMTRSCRCCGRRAHVATGARHQHRGGVRAQSHDRRQYRMGPAGRTRRAGSFSAWAPRSSPTSKNDSACRGATRRRGCGNSSPRCTRSGRPGRTAPTLRFEGEFYTHKIMTPMFTPEPQPYPGAEGVPRRRRRSDDRDVRRGRRRPPRSPDGLEALPRRGDNAGAAARHAALRPGSRRLRGVVRGDGGDR